MKVYVVQMEDDDRDTCIIKVVRSQKEAEEYVKIRNRHPSYSDVEVIEEFD